MARKYFGTDGIRARANGFKMTPDFVLKVGQAAGLTFQNGNHRHRVVIGKDTRLSGYMIENALTSGFTSVGMDVLLLGPMPTPAIAMLTRSMRADLGVMISASHNAFEDNGIKLFSPSGNKLSDNIELIIERLIDEDLNKKLADGEDIGRAKRIEGAHARYIEFAKHTLLRPIDLSGLRIVIDCANGAGYKVAPDTLFELGAEVIALGVSPNGSNINFECGSTHPQSLQAKVKELRADIGIALDGDADRVIIVDEKGQIVDGDQLLALIAKDWQQEGRLQGQAVVSTVMANFGFEKYLHSLNLNLERTAVGDRYVIERMREKNINIGGEPSGHIILSDFATTGDGLVTALQVLSVLKKHERPISELCHNFEPLPQIMKNVKFSHGKPLEHERVKSIIAQSEAKLQGKGRLVIRASGTEPVIRVMAEGEDLAQVEQIVDDIADEVRKVA